MEDETDLCSLDLGGGGGGCSRRTSEDGLVFAEAEEGGLADLVVGGPGGEADLGDGGGADPDGVFTGGGRVRCRTGQVLVSAVSRRLRRVTANFWLKPVPVRPA